MDALDAPLDMVRQVGLVGVIAAAGLAAAGLAYRRLTGARRGPLPAAGLAMAAAALVAIGVADTPERVGARLVVGMTAAAAGGLAAARLPWWVRPVLVLPGAALTIDSMDLDERAGVITPTVVAAAVLAVLVADTDRYLAASAAGPPLLAVSIFGMYATIPETGLILAVLVVAVPVALVGGPLRLARLGAAGSAASVVLLAAIVAEGGQTRAASIVGGLASLGVLALEPVARWLAPVTGRPPSCWRSPWLVRLVAIHVVVVLVASRVAGLRRGLTAAGIVAMVTAAVALAALTASTRNMERDSVRS